MERIIKFKAKTIIDGSWVEGDLLQHIDGTTLIGDNQGEFTDDGYGHLDYHNVYQVDPSTVCQFTGLKDKNGKEIWEHDILHNYIVYKGEVVYENGCFCIKQNDSIYRGYSLLELNQYCYSSKENTLKITNLGSKFDRKEEK